MKRFRLLSLAALLAAGCVAATTPPPKEKEKAAPVQTYTGTVRTGIMAIGGETTGILLETAANGTYELDTRGDREKAAQLEKLDGKKAVVTGEYRPRPGVEIKERRILIVASVAAAP